MESNLLQFSSSKKRSIPMQKTKIISWSHKGIEWSLSKDSFYKFHIKYDDMINNVIENVIRFNRYSKYIFS